MNNLSCNVESCMTNKAGGCCRPSIKVEGSAASASKETMCGSYTSKSGAGNNAGHCASANTCLDVHCSASACAYNCNGKCDSDSVCIDCHGGSAEKTECSTFKL